MASNASDYADSIAADIRQMTDAGVPFGRIYADTGELSDRLPDEDSDNSDEWSEATASDYLRDVLDIQYLVGRDGAYRAARVLIAFGGPTAWIDTRTGQLEVTWWSAPEFRELPHEFIAQLDDALEDEWEVTR